MSLLIKNGIAPQYNYKKINQIYIEDGLIQSIDGPEVTADTVIDASSLIIATGLADMHVHLRQPGFEYKETIESGLNAAAVGGFTVVAPMANTNPVIDSPEMVEYVLEKSINADTCRIAPIAAVTYGLKGERLTDFEALKAAGVKALSDDGAPLMNADLMRKALLSAKGTGLPIISHCEDLYMVGDKAVNEGAVSKKLQIEGRPAIAEEIMVMRDCMLAQETGGYVHIAHVSTKNSVDIIRSFKEKGVRITAETCPQYFMFTEDEILKKGALARVNPPLRTKDDVEAVINGLADGTIDVIVTDHAPHSTEEKSKPLTEAPSGMIGLETSLAAALTALYHTGRLSLQDLIVKMSVNPRRILGLEPVKIRKGGPADLVVFDPEQLWSVDPSMFKSKSRNTIFAEMELKGRVIHTIVGGRLIENPNNQAGIVKA